MIFKVFLILALSAALGKSTTPGGRIAGGRPTTIQENRFIVAVLYQGRQRCVGALISSWHVLSAADCLVDLEVENIQIRAGSTYSLTGGTIRDVGEVMIHPDYERLPRYGDIALVFLKEYFYIGGDIGLVYIPPQESHIPDGYPVKAVSWGFDSEDGQQLESLNVIDINMVSQDRCREAFADNDEVAIYDQVFCTQGQSVSMCRGDAGAPLILGETLIGLLSYASTCDDSVPDLFTRVDRHTGWILMHAVAPRTRAPWTDPDTYIQVVAPILKN